MLESRAPKHFREVRVVDLFVFFYLMLIILILIWTTFFLNLKYRFINLENYILLIIGLLISYVPLRLFAVGCIFMYKAFAPLKVRDRCRYTPTCSSYMIMSIFRYGLIIGITLGIKRINSCTPPNGGYDLPSIKKLFKKYTKEEEDN